MSSSQQQPKKPQTTAQTENTNPKTTARKTCAHKPPTTINQKEKTHIST
jgi:hypothetical protein